LVFAPFPDCRKRAPRGLPVDLAVLVLGGSALLIAIVLWFDNAQGGLTGNGVFKSLELKPWVADPATAPLFAANYLYYPLMGALCRGLDMLGVFVGDPRRQLTIINAVSGGLGLGIVYLLVRAVTADSLIALLAALFHLASSYVMFLAIVNEDIMPSYTVLLAAMALGSVWLAKPTVWRVIAVAALFSLAWLMEWRLMFPTLPALLAALWLCERQAARRFAWIALFGLSMLAVAGVVAWLWEGHDKSVGPFTLIWTGKAVNSVWAGFAWSKVGGLWDGMVAYLLGTAVSQLPGLPGWDIWRVLATIWIAIVIAVALPMLWRARHDPRARALAVVFGGTFVAGEIFNLYAQPQDPQMQINVMAWLTVGWALLLVAVRRRYGRRGLAALGGLTVALFAYNVWSLAPLRGLDGAWEAAIKRLERESDPSRTVWLMHDFGWAMVYGSLHWGLAEPGTVDLGPAPQAEPRFKWIGFIGQALRHPDWSDERLAADLRRNIDRALEQGYEVLVIGLWDLDLPRLEEATGSVASATRLEALRRVLHEDYVATLAFTDPVVGAVHRLQRKPAR
jgi:hypothetical protein